MDTKVGLAREVILQEARTLQSLADRLEEEPFSRAVELVVRCEGRVVVSGMGKAGLIARKISATLSSTGTPSLYLHPAEAVHGDLGRVLEEDVVLILSNSGETEEVVRLLDPVKRIGAALIALTGNKDSTLARWADIVLDLGTIDEAGGGFAPTASTTAMLAMGDALALAVQKERNFAPEDLIRFHPGGFLGRSLLKVKEIMRSGKKTPLVREEDPVKEVVLVMTTTPGRPGAAIVVDGGGRLSGIFTDGDLRRRLLEGSPSLLESPVREVMTRDPKRIHQDKLVSEAHQILRNNRIDQIPVVDEKDRPVGILDVQDILDFKTP
ncbi:MAG TPA: KpsF/GutQ family sugar-phosphate isomerase [Planctomycetes bacterium]|nr:KpsF/GutQ family sugar-phosphate isomerase [Planctomycetota bacterium]